MKQRWTRLIAKNIPTEFQESAFNSAFLKHHRNADELIIDTTEKVPLAAIYFTPLAMNKEQTKSIFREIQRRAHYACEIEKIGDGE